MFCSLSVRFFFAYSDLFVPSSLSLDDDDDGCGLCGQAIVKGAVEGFVGVLEF